MDAPAWALLSDPELLECRIASLGLSLDGTARPKSPADPFPQAAASALQPRIQQLYAELSARGLVFHPPCHVGDEWFVPVGIPAIYVPFFLVHDRLVALERTMVLEVEGDTPEEFMRLIRHETAHAYAYAYGLTRKKKWQQI